ncbi:hypothetical protein K1T71_008003 [Dendrolimus kikuchii]|uniref:Uncharacterized protein n=1 Tax=Dendrolimus kikuchii TaxID=765133 RepID=A0ACC1CYQ3_9NEOP|nr:hypothetical protein K1T71_008003 [Dendrolimus kikuchii]
MTNPVAFSQMLREKQMANSDFQLVVKKKHVDATLAEDYLNSNSREFYPIGCKDYDGEGFDSYNNKIHFSNNKGLLKRNWDRKEGIQQNSFLKLAKEIRNKMELISQLDYMIRKHPIEETKICLSLVEQQLLLWNQFKPDFEGEYNDDAYVPVHYMTDKSSLLSFGLLTRALHHRVLLIAATKDVAVIVHLFTEICHSVGLTHVKAVFVNKEEDSDLSDDMCLKECVGVITEKSDMESALDVFLGSTTSAPWKLSKIWIQECIYDEFKLALVRKCHIKKSDASSNETKSSESEFIFEEKRLLIDCTENSPNIAKSNLHTITVEAYRTNKELITLINDNSLFLSLWASDISEANEIAYAVTTPVVWINDYGCFIGPPKASQAIFSEVSSHEDEIYKHMYWLDKTSITVMSENLNKWKKLSYEKRKETIQNVISAKMEDMTVKGHIDEVSKWIHEINQPDPYKFIDITKGKICVGIDSIPEDDTYFDFKQTSVVDALQVLLHGSCIIIGAHTELYQKDIFDALLKAGVPVISEISIKEEKEESSQRRQVKLLLPYYINTLKTRVIISNYGTIFAN